MSTRRVTFWLMAIGLLTTALLAPKIGSAAPPTYTLTTDAVGSGSVDPASGSYEMNANVTATAVSLRAGLRSSPYGISPFPAPSWWVNSTTDMASRFEGAAPEVIWIVGEVLFPVDCGLSFPNPTPGTTYPNIVFKSEVDENEVYLNAFDQAGVKVWLQVEPGNANVSTLIDLVLTQYGHHPSVIGFGVDVEWYQNKIYQEGKAVTDAEAQAWSEGVRAYNPDYLLFTKHWLAEKMPPTYRTGMVFVNDSQGFRSLEAMVSEFTVWGQTFAPAGVGFQYGYVRDRKWWRKLSDPPGDIGQALLNSIPNTSDLVWVDFTAYEIWPEE